MGKYGTENLVAGVLNWLKLAEEHYGVIPIVYTGSIFYQLYLNGRIESYPLWIAAYSGSNRLKGIDWHFHQFSDKIRIKGIPASVDGNSFKGEIEELLELLIKT
ncbi:GH25 family lysozyme [Salegentibacter sp. HM20]